MNRWTDRPKIELHLHLEGAVPPDFIRRLAAEKKVSLEGLFDADGNYQYDDFPGFLAAYEQATSVLKSAQDYYRLTRNVLQQSASQNVIYTEIFISPDFCGDGGPGAWDEYLAAMEEAAAIEERDHGITCRFIPTCVRHFGPDRARKVAGLVVKRLDPFVVGFGMGGNETMYEAKDFSFAFGEAGEAGLGLTSHAGEFGGAQSVISSLDQLKISRVGHGVRATEDEDLVRRLVNENIVLEVNPGSNIALGVFDKWENHTIRPLREAGVKVTLSTDDPPFFHTDISHEYNMMSEIFGWQGEDFDEIDRNALNAAFCSEETREDIKKRMTGEIHGE